MPLIALASLKSSPGVTTAALALAAAWPTRRCLLVEADPSGGDLGPWLGMPPAPGLASLAAVARHEHGRSEIWRHAQELAGEAGVIVAPAGAEQAAACLATLAGTDIFREFAEGPAAAFADLGRLDPGSPSLELAAQATVTLLLVRPRVSELSHLAPRIGGLNRAGLNLGLILAAAPSRTPAEPAYDADEVAGALNIPVHASFPHDRLAAGNLVRDRGELLRGRRLSPLPQAVADLAAALYAGYRPAPLPPGGLAAVRGGLRREVAAGGRSR